MSFNLKVVGAFPFDLQSPFSSYAVDDRSAEIVHPFFFD